MLTQALDPSRMSKHLLWAGGQSQPWGMDVVRMAGMALILSGGWEVGQGDTHMSR